MNSNEANRLLVRLTLAVKDLTDQRSGQREAPLVLAVRNLRDWSGRGYPQGSNGSRSSNGSSSVERAAEHVDWFARVSDDLEMHFEFGVAALEKAARIVQAHTNVTNKSPEPVCRICERVTINGDPGRAPHPKSQQRVHVKGTRLCDFHDDFAKRYQLDPDVIHPRINWWHLEHLGERIPFALVRECHPVEFEAHHGERRSA